MVHFFTALTCLLAVFVKAGDKVSQFSNSKKETREFHSPIGNETHKHSVLVPVGASTGTLKSSNRLGEASLKAICARLEDTQSIFYLPPSGLKKSWPVGPGTTCKLLNVQEYQVANGQFKGVSLVFARVDSEVPNWDKMAIRSSDNAHRYIFALVDLSAKPNPKILELVGWEQGYCVRETSAGCEAGVDVGDSYTSPALDFVTDAEIVLKVDFYESYKATQFRWTRVGAILKREEI